MDTEFQNQDRDLDSDLTEEIPSSEEEKPFDDLESNFEEEKKEDEIDIDELIRNEGPCPVIPQHLLGKNTSLKISFVHEDLFDSDFVNFLLQRDYKFYKKLKRYNSVCHFNYNQEPFSYMYEKKSWDLTPMEKFQLTMRNATVPLNSSPFKEDGVSSYFEFQTLYNPISCHSYWNRNRVLAERNIGRFKKVALRYNMDNFEEYEGENISLADGDYFDLTPIKFSGQSVRLNDRNIPDDEIFDESMNRYEWPSFYLTMDDKPSVFSSPRSSDDVGMEEDLALRRGYEDKEDDLLNEE